MSDNSTPSTDTTELAANVTATGTASRKTTDIPAEHQPFADAILAMDPLAVPRTHSIPEGWGAAPLNLQASALPPEMAREVEAKVNALGDVTPEVRAAKEAEFTAAAVRSKRVDLIAKIGVGHDATPYHREQADISREVADLNREFERIQADLAHVSRYEMDYDPKTGEPTPVPVYSVTGTRQRAYIAQQEDILRRIRLLVNPDGTPGIEGARRVREALAVSAAAQAELARQVSEEAEAKSLAQTMGREERVKARAESIVRMSRNTR